MHNFLTFEQFITPDVLIFFYYIGVFFLPFLLWNYRKKVTLIYNSYQSDNKTFVILMLIISFLFMQLFWRMMFEAMIGYFDMHNYLQELAKQIH